MTIIERFGAQLRCVHSALTIWEECRTRGYTRLGSLAEAVLAYTAAMKLEALPDELGVIWGAECGYEVPGNPRLPDTLDPCPTCEEHGETEPCADCRFGASGTSYDSGVAREAEVYGVVGLPIDVPTMPSWPSQEHMDSINKWRTAVGAEPHDKPTYERYYGALPAASDGDYDETDGDDDTDAFAGPSRAHYDSICKHLRLRGYADLDYDDYVAAYGAFPTPKQDPAHVHEAAPLNEAPTQEPMPSLAAMDRINTMRATSGIPQYTRELYEQVYGTIGALPTEVPPYDRTGSFFALPPRTTEFPDNTVVHLAAGLTDEQCMAFQMISHALMEHDSTYVGAYPVATDHAERTIVAREAAGRVQSLADGLTAVASN